MGELLISEHPVLLLLYGVALFLCLFDKYHGSTHGRFSLISALLAVITCAYAILLGVGTQEVLVVLLLFLCLNLEGWNEF